MDVLSDSDIYGILKKFDLADTSTYSTGDLVKIADAGGAQYTVNGSYLKAGDEIIINATCQKPHSRDVISPIQMTCRGFEEIQVRIDEMTRKIKADLNLTQAQIAGDIDKNLGEITTPNAEAWAYYVEARRYQFRGESDKAIPLLQKALALDPEFVMAYQALASAHYSIADYPEAQNLLTRTLELVQKHPERISERDRYFIELYYYSYDKPEPEWAKSIEAGRKLLALYPDDPMGNFEMAVIYDIIEEWDEALRYYEKSMAGGPACGHLFGHGQCVTGPRASRLRRRRSSKGISARSKTRRRAIGVWPTSTSPRIASTSPPGSLRRLRRSPPTTTQIVCFAGTSFT